MVWCQWLEEQFDLVKEVGWSLLLWLFQVTCNHVWLFFMKNVSEYLAMFGKIKMYVEYEHVEELGSRKLSGPQLANRKQN